MRTLERLAGHFLDVVAGLPTLKIFGRAKAQAAAVREISERYRVAAMATLRITFLSSLILELVATISVAMVAVAIGLRLLSASLDFRTALFVLILAPEAYCRCASSAPTTTRAPRGWPPPSACSRCSRRHCRRGERVSDVPDPAGTAITVERLRVSYPGRERPALDGVSPDDRARARCSRWSGRAAAASRRCSQPCSDSCQAQSGSMRSAASILPSSIPPRGGRRLAWVPQRPHLFAASVADNVRLGRADASDAGGRGRDRAAGLTEVVVERLPDGIETVLGDRGAGPLRRRAPTGRSRAGVPARRAAAAARRADGEPRRRAPSAS